MLMPFSANTALLLQTVRRQATCNLFAACLLALLSLLGGCAQVAPKPLASRPAVNTISHYGLEGSITIQQPNGSQRANISWQHSRDSDDLLISSPMGMGLAELTRKDGKVVLETADNRHFAADSLDELALTALDMPIPLNGMARWLIGDLPAGSVSLRDQLARPREANVDGWHIHFNHYESDQPNALPGSLHLERGDMTITLDVSEWQIP